MVKAIKWLCLGLLTVLVTLLAVPSGGAIRGDGTSCRAFVQAGSTNLNLTNDITIAMWIIKEVGMTGNAEFINKGRDSGGTLCNYCIRGDNAGGLELYWANPNGTFHSIVSNTKCTQTNTPIHIAVTHQFGNTNNSMFWINGVRAGVSKSLGTPQSTGAITNTGRLTFLGITGAEHFKGQVIECGVWDVRLTGEEIYSMAKSQLINLGYFKGPRPDRLRGYWTFHEMPAFQTASGQAWKDYSGWNSHLTATNSPTTRPLILSVP